MRIDLREMSNEVAHAVAMAEYVYQRAQLPENPPKRAASEDEQSVSEPTEVNNTPLRTSVVNLKGKVDPSIQKKETKIEKTIYSSNTLAKVKTPYVN